MGKRTAQTGGIKIRIRREGRSAGGGRGEGEGVGDVQIIERGKTKL